MSHRKSLRRYSRATRLAKNVTASDFNYMPIHEDVQVGDVEAVARQLDEDVWIDMRDEREGLTPAVGSEAASVEMVRLLIERGADVNAIESADNHSVLAHAVREGSVAKVEALLNAEADIQYQREAGYGVLINAVHSRAMSEGELLPLIDLLLARGASPLSESDYGESALSVSSHRGSFDVVERLLAAGADAALLEWNELHRADALGSVADVENLPSSSTFGHQWRLQGYNP